MSAAVSLNHGTPEARREAVRAGKALRVSNLTIARNDPAAFAEYVLRHERTNRRISLAPMHEEWHELMSAEKRLILWSHVEAGKTTQLIGRLAYEIGKDPSKRFAVVGISQGAASKIVTSVSRYLESPQYRAVFPKIRKGKQWTKVAITVRRDVFSKDPTLQAIGVKGHVVGARLDGVLLDDVLDHQNTRTPEQRKELLTWYLAEFVGRLTEDAFVWIIGNAYYSDDLLHELATKFGFKFARYPVANDNGEPSFPQEWSRARIAKKEEELGGKGSTEANRQLYCVPRSDESSRVKEAWLTACLARGEDVGLPARITEADLKELSQPPVYNAQGEVEIEGIDATTHTGVDIGIGKTKRAGKTVLMSYLRWPNQDLQIVGLKSGRWDSPVIVGNVLSEQSRFCSTVGVESNAAQKFILDDVYKEDPGAQLYVRAHNTGANKLHPVIGVEGLFADLARSRLVIPSVRSKSGKLVGATPEIQEFLADLLDYTPDSHTSDYIMAAWIGREDARLKHLPDANEATVDVKIIGARSDVPLSQAEREELSPDDAPWASQLSGGRRRKRDPLG